MVRLRKLPKPWTERQKNELRLHYGRVTMARLCSLTEHTGRDVRRMSEILRLNTSPRRYQVSGWTPELDEQLSRYRERGYSYDATAHLLGVGRGAVRNRCYYLGIVSSIVPEGDFAERACPESLRHCDARPGTEEKIAIMRQRVEARACACQPGDGPQVNLD